MLTVKDYGRGLPKPILKSKGLGLRIMAYRATMIGATLEIKRAGRRGTQVSCLCLYPRLSSQPRDPA